MRKRIALFSTNSANNYQVYMETSARAVTERHGFDLDVWRSAEGEQENPIVHLAQVVECLRQGPDRAPDAVLIQPIGTNCSAVVEAAAQVGVPCVVLNRRPDFLAGMRLQFPGVPLFSVGPDHRAIGRIQGDQFRALLPRGGWLLYVQGIEGATSTKDRREGMMASIAGSGIEVDSLFGDWLRERAEKVVEEWLARLTPAERIPDLFGCQSDGMAKGVSCVLERLAAALRDPGLARRPITGCDGAPGYGQRLVLDGILTTTITRGSASVAAIEALADYFERGVFPPPHLDMPVDSFPPVDSLKARASSSTS